MRADKKIAFGVLACGVAVGVAQERLHGPYTIAYASFGPLNTAVLIANADGTGERPLLDTSVLDANPSFSPDARWVLFTSRRGGSDDIFEFVSTGPNWSVSLMIRPSTTRR